MAACLPSKCPMQQADAIAAYVMALKQPAAVQLPQALPRRATPRPVSDSSTEKGIARAATWYADGAVCSAPTSRMSGATARRRKSNRRCAIPERRPPARRAAADGWTWSSAGLSGGDRAPARRSNAARYREEREHVRPATAGDGWQAASAIEGSGGGDRARKIADAEGRSDPEEMRNLVAYLSRLSTDPNAKAMLARANSARAFRSPKSRIPSRAPGRLTTAT